MSLVYITAHDENICNIENIRVGKLHHKLPKYNSIYRKKNKDDSINQIERQASKKITVGHVETTSGLCNAANYIKKGDDIRELPAVPKKADILKKKRQKQINFIVNNVKKLKMAAPINYAYRYVDTTRGERHNLQGSGLIPEYVFSKKFGKPPAYLKTLQRKIQAASSTSQLKEDENTRSIRELSDSERNMILMGLKANYSQLYKTFQLLPIFTDTIPKKQQKRKLEQELKGLEQDILLIESNPVILICDD